MHPSLRRLSYVAVVVTVSACGAPLRDAATGSATEAARTARHAASATTGLTTLVPGPCGAVNVCRPALAIPQPPAASVRPHAHTAVYGNVDFSTYGGLVDMDVNPDPSHLSSIPSNVITVGYLDFDRCSGAGIADRHGNGRNGSASDANAKPDCTALSRSPSATSAFYAYRSGASLVTTADGAVQLVGDPASSALQSLVTSYVTQHYGGYNWVQFDDETSPADNGPAAFCGSLGTDGPNGYVCDGSPYGALTSIGDLTGFSTSEFQTGEIAMADAVTAALSAAGGPTNLLASAGRGVVVNSINQYSPGNAGRSEAEILAADDKNVLAAICEACFDSGYVPHEQASETAFAYVTNTLGKPVIDITYSYAPNAGIGPQGTTQTTRDSTLAKLLLNYSPVTTYEAPESCQPTGSYAGANPSGFPLCPEAAFDFFPAGPVVTGTAGLTYKLGYCYENANLLGTCAALVNLGNGPLGIPAATALHVNTTTDFAGCFSNGILGGAACFTAQDPSSPLATYVLNPGDGITMLLDPAPNVTL